VKRRDDSNLISAAIMALTRLQPLLPHVRIARPVPVVTYCLVYVQDSVVHKTLFWVAIIILQLEDAQLYEHGLALLEQNLRTLDSHGLFEYEVNITQMFVSP